MYSILKQKLKGAESDRARLEVRVDELESIEIPTQDPSPEKLIVSDFQPVLELLANLSAKDYRPISTDPPCKLVEYLNHIC